MKQIIPTLLSQDRKASIKKLKNYQNVFDWIQLDIIDGIFSPGKTLQLNDLKTIKELKKFKPDIHLMVDNPSLFLPDCRKIKAKRIIGHIELMKNQADFIKKAKKICSRVGLAIDLPTKLNKLNLRLLAKIDVVLLMSVKAGQGGQGFSQLVIPKIKKLVKIKKERKLKFKIALDGGIKPGTIKVPYKAGAEIFYVGSFLEKEPKKALNNLLSL